MLYRLFVVCLVSTAAILAQAPRDQHLQLGNSLLSRWIPGAAGPENEETLRRAQAEFEAVLALDPNNLPALRALASIATAQIGTTRDPVQKERIMLAASDWNKKVIAVDPQSKEAYYSLGVLAWMKFYPELMAARSRLGMRPEDPGPLNDFNTKQDLRSRLGDTVDEGIRNLEKALELDPQYDDAMAYLNLLIRERADLRDTGADYRFDIQTADSWVQKALDTKRSKAGHAGGGTSVMIVPAPPPPPPPPPMRGLPSNAPTKIRINGNVQAANLVYKVDPIYPPLAREARVQGTVQMNVQVADTGKVESVQLVSGHPLLVPSALEAVKQYVYKPTLLNGQPIAVITTVEVRFELDK